MLSVIQTSITDLKVDAMVNAANVYLSRGSGVCGHIFKVAGPELDQACTKIGHCNTGEAVITPGFNSKAKYIIHTVGPKYFENHPDRAKQLRNCYINSCQLALDNNCRSISFPAISIGIYGYPIDEAAEIAVKACQDFLEQTKDSLDIVLTAFDENTYKELIKFLGESI